MNRLVPLLIPKSCSSLLVRTKMTIPRKPRTPEWHEQIRGNQSILEQLKEKKKTLQPQVKVLGERLKNKDSVTSFRALLVQEKLKEQLQNIEKEISVEKNQSTKPTKMPWHGWIRNRPGHGNYSHWKFRSVRRNCFSSLRRKFVASRCPVCADNWFPVYSEVDKLKIYVDPSTNLAISNKVTNVCCYKQSVLEEAIYAAQSKGLLELPRGNIRPAWSAEEIYGKDRTELTGPRQRYNKKYRHLPGNVWYEEHNPHFNHRPLPRLKEKKFHQIDYE